MADIKAAVATYSLPSSTGNFTVSIPGSPGWTPKACIVQFVKAGTDAAICTGFSDGSNERACMGFAKDNQATTDANRMHRNDAVLYVKNSFSGSVVLEVSAVTGTGVGPTTDGWVFNMVSNPPSIHSVNILVTFLGGADLNAVVGSFTTAVVDGNTVDVDTGQDDPDIVLFMGNNRNVNAGANDIQNGHLGASVNGGSILSAAVGSYNQGGASTSAVITNVRDNAALVPFQTIHGLVTAFGDSPASFTFETTDGSSNLRDASYLSLKLNGGDAWVGIVDTPTSGASDWSITGPGFLPVVALGMFTRNTALGDRNSGSLPVCPFAADANGAKSFCLMSQDNVGTTNENGAYYAGLVQATDPDDASTVLYQFDDLALTATGAKVAAADLTTVEGTAFKAMMIAIGAGAGAAGGGVNDGGFIHMGSLGGM